MIVLSIDVGIKNLALCLYDSAKRSIDFWKVITISAVNGDMARGVIKAMEKDIVNDIDMKSIDTVLIERQPGRRNLKIKSIENFLHMYFALTSSLNDHKLVVKLYHPRHKLSGTGCEHHGKSAQTYRERKKASVAICKTWLASQHPCQEKWKAMFERRGTKRDDLADALAQVLSFCGHYETLKDCSKKIEQNVDVRARKPTEKQLKSGNLSRSNLKHLIIKEFDSKTSTVEILSSKLRSHSAAMKAIKKLYDNDVERCIRHLNV